MLTMNSSTCLVCIQSDSFIACPSPPPSPLLLPPYYSNDGIRCQKGNEKAKMTDLTWETIYILNINICLFVCLSCEELPSSIWLLHKHYKYCSSKYARCSSVQICIWLCGWKPQFHLKSGVRVLSTCRKEGLKKQLQLESMTTFLGKEFNHSNAPHGNSSVSSEKQRSPL